MIIKSIDSPIEHGQKKGNPNALMHFGVGLSSKQRDLLLKLPDFDSKALVEKNAVSMSDLSALTAFTGDEFAMFTKNKKRLIIRGNANSVNIDIDTAKSLAADGYRWSGHTHPGIGEFSLVASDGDFEILSSFPQTQSVIYNSLGNHEVFY
ncbi:MAG: hypothetical protein LBM59_00950 [Ruminococcus sp.]|nr:hypothetical protein [Ruminococcus sp.]